MSPNHQLVHWEKTAPFGLTLTPAELCYGLAIVIIFAVYMRMRLLRNAAKAGKIVSKNKDKVWNADTLKFGTADLFREIQVAWSKRNLGPVQKRLEPKLFEAWTERLAELRLERRREAYSRVAVSAVEILNAKDYLDDAKDEFTARIEFEAVESGSGAAPAETPGAGELRLFVEYWKMGRHKDAWRVREVMRDGVLARMSLALEPSVDEGVDKDGKSP